MKAIVSISAAAIMSAVMLSASVGTASAAYCSYRATDNAGHAIDEGAGARKMSTACKRARRQCNRILKRKQKRGKFGRSRGCGKVVEVPR
ncbi:MAG: hypothetical protein DHS20C08_10350 [Rhodomicrobium sp.]|nr:MAG: hypothetical protein DHS20C08_10350 [Rhodomicrobium sp.]